MSSSKIKNDQNRERHELFESDCVTHRKVWIAFLNSMRLIFAGTVLFYFGVVFTGQNFLVVLVVPGLVLVSCGLLFLGQNMLFDRDKESLFINANFCFSLAFVSLVATVFVLRLPLENLHDLNHQRLLAALPPVLIFLLLLGTINCVKFCTIMKDFWSRVESEQDDSWQSEKRTKMANLAESWGFSKKLLSRTVLFPGSFFLALLLVFALQDEFLVFQSPEFFPSLLMPLVTLAILFAWLPLWGCVHFLVSQYRTIRFVYALTSCVSNRLPHSRE